jgi:tetraprenyl-beta-curcumene synthase
MTLQTRVPSAIDARAVGVLDRFALAAAFTGAARRYWTGVFPLLRRELERWRERALQIPDPVLRRLALDAPLQRGNLEGAAAFAAFVPRAHRAAVVRALVAYQSAYNYLDLLAEQPLTDPVTGARGLHQALLDSLDPALGTESGAETESQGRADGWAGTESSDYYASYPQRDDGGYLSALVRECRTALATMPSYAAVATATCRATERIVHFQSLNLSEAQGDHAAFARWARAEIPPGVDLQWWEAAAAGGSALGVYALIAAAAAPVVDAGDVEAIEHAYFPWIGGLHSLLDHLVDAGEDAARGQRNLIDYYPTTEQAAERMRTLAERATAAARALRDPDRRHTIMLAGMAANYLSEPRATAPDANPIARNVRAAIGELVAPSLLVFRARRLAGELAGSSRVAVLPSSSPVGALKAGAVLDERDSRVAMRLGR